MRKDRLALFKAMFTVKADAIKAALFKVKVLAKKKKKKVQHYSDFI